MKVYTVTFNSNVSFGARLQAYALAIFLNDQNDIECEILNYYYPGWKISWKLFPKPKSFRDLLKNIYLALHVREVIEIKKKQRMFREFVSECMPVAKEKYDRTKLLQSPPLADAFVCGSDQVWNLTRTRDLTFFLDFVKKGTAKKLSYAASISEPWTKADIEILKPWLNEFDGLSIREEGNLPQLREVLPDKNPIVVCDPVFLLSKQEWESFSSTQLCPQEPYIFCYFIGADLLVIEIVAKIKKLLGYKVVYLQLNLNARDHFHSDKTIIAADPKDFVGLIKNASFVVTNSFHASAFSLLFRKNFVSIPRKKDNERIKSLIKVFKISDVFMTREKLGKLTKEDLMVDYSLTDAAYTEFTDFSKNYLLDTLYGKESN